jgi:hypothetical protein
VKALIVHSTHATMQNSAIHGEFTDSRSAIHITLALHNGYFKKNKKRLRSKILD